MQMITTRIQRGAAKSLSLASNYARSTTLRLRDSFGRRPSARHMAVVLTAVRIAFAPMPVATAHAAGAGSDADIPPSTSPTVSFSPTELNTFTVPTPDLSVIETGKSNATLQAEAVAAAAAAEQKRQQEAAQAAALVAAAQAKAQAAAVRQAASIDIGGTSVQQKLRDAAASAFGADQVDAFMAIVGEESGFNPNAYNVHSGACGLFQALPCSKMGGMAVDNQIRWGIGYIRARYGTPKNAWAFHLIHNYY